MNILVLFASPRPQGNTAALLAPFTQTLLEQQHAVKTLSLYQMQLLPCLACRSCQRDHTTFGCPLPDQGQELFDAITACDCIVLASPIYSWYCTPPLKAALDRMVYGMNKFYGETKGPALWRGKLVALLTTCGYPPDKGADLWEEGMRRYCKHSRLHFIGSLTERHVGYDQPFMDAEKQQAAVEFAKRVSMSRNMK